MSKKHQIESLTMALDEMRAAFHRQGDRADALAEKVLALTEENERLKGDFEQWAKENRYFKIGPASTTREEIARKWGYIKLDARTIQRLRWFSEGRANDETVSAYEVHNLINPVLAAIDEGDPT